MNPRNAAAIALAGLTSLGHAAGTDVALGRQLYHEGVNARGEPLRALTGLPPSPVTGLRAACAECHGADARGGPMPGASAPDIRWSTLAEGTPAGAKKPYDEAAFALGVNEGLTLTRNPVGLAMPRYSLSRREVGALVAYLKTLR